MPFTFSSRSCANLVGVHPDLVAVIARGLSLSEVDFMITEGLRDRARQVQLVNAGASQTMNSRHLTGHAVDVAAWVGGEIRWDWPLYGEIAGAVKLAADELDVPIVWGGDWRSLRDGPHFELSREVYPAA
jgi:peptidoglycan L-alanyl-D-glutamate endopeptidase CwlK